MDQPERIDLSFRPASYFGHLPLERRALTRITGRVRRGLAARALAAGEDVPPSLLEGTLDPETRAAFTSLHPSLLGGEFLPPHADGEVEIASVSLRSTTSDQVSVRARMGRGRILYRVVDEYDGELVDEAWGPRSSRRPLTLRRIIGVIDRAYDVFEILRDNLDGGADRAALAAFVTVSSPFYPQLGRHYAAALRAWLEESWPGDDDEAADD